MLENEIGVPLFARHGRGMKLTEAGRQLLEHIGSPLRQLESSFDEAPFVRPNVSRDAFHWE